MSVSKIDKIKNGLDHCLFPYAIPKCDGCLYNRKHGAIQHYCDCRSQLLTDAKSVYDLLVKTAREARKDGERENDL